jgi:hypothetical protein
MTTPLDERYGRTVGTRRRARLLAVVAGAAAVGVAIAWVIWVGLFGPGASLDTRDLGYAQHGDDEIEVRYEVTAQAGARVSCAVQALSNDFSIVGWKVVALPVSDQRTRQLRETLRTTEPAVTGLIYRCWLT